jgi:hypothetical protein
MEGLAVTKTCRIAQGLILNGRSRMHQSHRNDIESQTTMRYART